MPDFSIPILTESSPQIGEKGTKLVQEAKAQSNLKLSHSDPGHGRTGLLASWAPTKLKRYRRDLSPAQRRED